MQQKKLGIKKVPCIRLDYMTDEERKKYGLAHNFTAEQSEWDMPKYELELINLSELGVDLSLFMKDDEEENQGEKSKEKVYESMELKAFEHHDYIVFLFDNQMDWLNVVSEFGLKKVDCGYGKTSKIGLGRVVSGKELLQRLRNTSPDSVEGES